MDDNVGWEKESFLCFSLLSMEAAIERTTQLYLPSPTPGKKTSLLPAAGGGDGDRGSGKRERDSAVVEREERERERDSAVCPSCFHPCKEMRHNHMPFSPPPPSPPPTWQKFEQRCNHHRYSSPPIAYPLLPAMFVNQLSRNIGTVGSFSGLPPW